MTDELTSEAELPLDTAGTRLKRAREAAGLTLKQLVETTKIPERHLLALEAGDFTALPGRTYATGFGRSYAKALGLDEVAILAAIRAELSAVEPEPTRRMVQTFEPGDPSRLPSSALAWVTGLVALALVAAAVWYLRSGQDASEQLPPLLPEASQGAAPQSQDSTTPPVPGGPVVFTALVPDLWVKFYDGNGTQLLQKQLAQGESYTIPAAVPEVLLWTGRPESLAITIGGQPVAKLSDVQRTMKDVPVTAAALLGRGSPAATSAATNGQSGAAATPPATRNAARPQTRLDRRDRPAPAARQSITDQGATPVPLPPVDAIPALSPSSGQSAPAGT